MNLLILHSTDDATIDACWSSNIGRTWESFSKRSERCSPGSKF